MTALEILEFEAIKLLDELSVAVRVCDDQKSLECHRDTLIFMLADLQAKKLKSTSWREQQNIREWLCEEVAFVQEKN